MYADNTIWLPPPQCYELLRLCQINDIDEVVDFAKARNNKGITLQFPIYYEANDGAVFAYPGEKKCSTRQHPKQFLLSLIQFIN